MRRDVRRQHAQAMLRIDRVQQHLIHAAVRATVGAHHHLAMVAPAQTFEILGPVAHRNQDLPYVFGVHHAHGVARFTDTAPAARVTGIASAIRASYATAVPGACFTYAPGTVTP